MTSPFTFLNNLDYTCHKHWNKSQFFWDSLGLALSFPEELQELVPLCAPAAVLQCSAV